MRKLKLGILGVSNHFLKRCRIPIQQSEILEIVAIASRNIDKATRVATTYNIAKAYGSYEELLNDKAVEAVYIPLPNHMHAEWTKKAADAGKHILCEKPLTLNVKEASAVADYCNAKHVKLMEAFMYRFHPQWIRAKELLVSGELGKIVSIHTFFGYNNPDPNNIRNIFEYGGGALMDIGCYAINVPRFLSSQEPTRVISLIKRHETFNTDAIVSSMLDFPDFQSSFSVSTSVHPYQKVEVFCTQGRLVIDIPFNTYQDVEVKISVTNYIGTRDLWFAPTDQYKMLFESFAKSIIENKEVATPINDAIQNMKVIDALIQSEHSKQWVYIER